MDMPQKILVPVDLSDRSASAVAYAGMLAMRFDAEVVLTTNVNLPEQAAFEDLAEAEGVSVEEAGEIALRRIAREHAPNVEITTALAFRDFPAEGILATAEVEDVDLIVLASHGRTGMKRKLLGSVAEKVARSAGVPVLIVPARDTE